MTSWTRRTHVTSTRINHSHPLPLFMHSCIHAFIHSKIFSHANKRLKRFVAKLVDIDIMIRSTKKLSFKKPDLTTLKELGALVANPEDFRHQHGRLLNLLKTNVEEGLLETLIKFYDPLYHCFTFPDYQLVPTLEEYSYLVGLPVTNQIPFHGLETSPKMQTIAQALHLEPSIVKSNLTIKSRLLGFPASFLYKQAFTFAKALSHDAFYSILSLLIYGLVLFPNIDNFIDFRAIQIFLIKNPVPTLLANTYHSIHDRTLAGRGTILCCTPLLRSWFTLHLPPSFKQNPENQVWSQRIMSLTPSDIVWYNAAYDTGSFIDSCGEYPNVPLIGINGGISYNPALARRQFGCPMKDKPNNLALSSSFYLNSEDHESQRGKFIRAWHAILRINRNQLGKKSDVIHESYTQWVIDRAASFGMPYPITRCVSATMSSVSLPLLPSTEAEHRDCLAKISRERSMWKRRYQEAESEIETLKAQLEQKDRQLLHKNQQLIERDSLLLRKDALLQQDAKRKKMQRDLFSSYQPGSASDNEA